MKLSGFIKATALSTLLLAGCSRGPLQKVEQLTTPLTEMADSLCKSTQGVLKDATMKCFYVDTVEITQKDIKNPQKYMNRLTRRAKMNIPHDVIESSNSGEMTMTSSGAGLSLGGGLAMGMDGKIGVDLSGGSSSTYIDKFVESSVKPVVGKGVFTDKSGKTFYIPIAGYGVPK